MNIKKYLKEYSSYVAWTIGLVSMVISLYFSEILGIAPCVLCWYQRIFMYPLVFIVGVGIIRRDVNFFWYAIPLSVVGFLVALYHNLLVWHLVPEALVPCTTGVSCVTQTWTALNFITIPLLSLMAFALITLLIMFHHKVNQND